MREHMKSILYSALVGSLALALATGGAQAATDKEKRPERAKPQQRSVKVQAARPTNTGTTMSAHRNVSAAQYRQQSYAKPRTSSAVNRAPRQASAMRATATPATIRGRNLARNERMRERNAQMNQQFRARRDVAVNQGKRPTSTTAVTARDRNASANRNRNLAVNRDRNVGVNRTRNVDANRERNLAVDRTRNADVNRFRNANEFRGRNNVAINR